MEGVLQIIKKVLCISVHILYHQVMKTISTFAKMLTTGKVAARIAVSLILKIRSSYQNSTQTAQSLAA